MSDLISRDDAIKCCRNEWEEEVEERLRLLPSAERTGEWLHPYKSDVACECSACHMQMPITDWFHFCPNCGAKMEGERNE